MSPVYRFLICAMVGLSCLVDGDGAAAQTPVSVAVRGTLAIEVGSGEVITFPSAAANIFVADPKVADVHAASPTESVRFRGWSGPHDSRCVG